MIAGVVITLLCNLLASCYPVAIAKEFNASSIAVHKDITSMKSLYFDGKRKTEVESSFEATDFSETLHPSPSMAPLIVPFSSELSVEPTIQPVLVTFNVTFYFHNSTAVSLGTDSQYVITVAVASTLQLFFNSVNYVSQIPLQKPSNVDNYDAADFDVAVVVLVTASALDFLSLPEPYINVTQNATLLYWYLRDTLTNAVDSGKFVAVVREYSVMYGAVETLYVSNVTALVTSYNSSTVTTFDEPPNNDVVYDFKFYFNPLLYNAILIPHILSILFGSIIVSYILYRLIDCYFERKMQEHRRRNVNAVRLSVSK